MFYFLRHNVDASCHKHFVVVFGEQQTTPLTSDVCHQLAAVQCSCVYCTWRSNRCRWPHAMKPDNGRESRFLSPPLAFDALVRVGPRRNSAITFGTEKLECYCWLTDGEKNSKTCLLVSTQCTKVTEGRTDEQTNNARRHRPRLCIASRGNT